MPDRIIRDELLGSPRYWHLSSDTARMLFVHLALRADDLGIFRAANYTIRQTCFGVDHKPGPEALAKLLTELADADLVRLWQDENGAEFGFIPRWKQRLRLVKPRFPLPPIALRDNYINALIAKMPDICPTPVSHLSAEVKRSRSEVNLNTKSTTGAVPVDNSGLTWSEHWQAKGKALGINPNPGESTRQYCLRVSAHVKAT